MLELHPIEALYDNYVWAIHDGHQAVLVDPGEAAPILAWLERQRMHLAAIVVTHHHGDHIGGIGELQGLAPTPVYGPGNIAAVTHPLGDGDRLTLTAPGLDLEVLAVPGHTLDHLAYYGHGWLFCGDTLFSCGCGRVFEGTAAQMHASLQRLATLPDETWVCCAHEYTLDNIAFALEVDPDNAVLREWAGEARGLRQQRRPTLPTLLGLEKRVNPFLRCAHPALRRAVHADDARQEAGADQVFARLRAMKNVYRPGVRQAVVSNTMV